MDFCSEVSTTARLSDGGLVVVDVVYLCPDPRGARQAWEERLRVCLVFNKLDRLVIEMGYSLSKLTSACVTCFTRSTA